MKIKKEVVVGIILTIVVLGVIGVVILGQNKNDGKFQDVQVTTEVESESQSQEDSKTAMETTIIKCCYELKYIFAVDSFENPKDISVSKLTQYGLCHLYYSSILDAPERENLEYRDASKEDIKNVLKNQFNLDDIDVEKSDLYNKSEDKIEMWIPSYSEQVYFDYTSEEQGDDLILNVTYYSNEVKSEVKGNLTITVAKNGDRYYIKGMK